MYHLIYPCRRVRQELQLKNTQEIVMLIATCLRELVLIISIFSYPSVLVSLLAICVRLRLHNCLPDPHLLLFQVVNDSNTEASHSFSANSQKLYFLIATVEFNAQSVLLRYKAFFKCYHEVLKKAILRKANIIQQGKII